MPPITVYEAGGLYFVNDGQHRVALARQVGGAYIDAELTAIETHTSCTQGLTSSSGCTPSSTVD
jgi:hypothetical protein